MQNDHPAQIAKPQSQKCQPEQSSRKQSGNQNSLSPSTPAAAAARSCPFQSSPPTGNRYHQSTMTGNSTPPPLNLFGNVDLDSDAPFGEDKLKMTPPALSPMPQLPPLSSDDVFGSTTVRCSEDVESEDYHEILIEQRKRARAGLPPLVTPPGGQWSMVVGLGADYSNRKDRRCHDG
jgi:hypothetical protein